MSIKGNIEASEGIKGTIHTMPDITIPTKLEDMPAKCEYIEAKVEPSQE